MNFPVRKQKIHLKERRMQTIGKSQIRHIVCLFSSNIFFCINFLLTYFRNKYLMFYYYFTVPESLFIYPLTHYLFVFQISTDLSSSPLTLVFHLHSAIQPTLWNFLLLILYLSVPIFAFSSLFKNKFYMFAENFF